MSRFVDGLVVSGLVAGVVWYTRRDRSKAEAATRTAERLVAVAEVRASDVAAVPVSAGTRPPVVATPAAGTSAPATSTAPATRAASAPLTRRFDDLFRQHGQGLPVAYLRALAYAESGLNPSDPKGLINVVPIALADYNRRHPEAPIGPDRMRDPASNIRVAADILRAIVGSYRRNHGDVPNLIEDWGNPRFVELLTLGWNAGFSELAGVGRVVRYLMVQPQASRPAAVTVDVIAANARTYDASAHLSNPRKLAFAKRVAATYAHEVERDRLDRIAIA